MDKRGGKRRDPIREKYWRRTIRDQQRISLAVRAFSLREGLKDWTLRWWRQELARRDQRPTTDSRREGKGEPTEAAPIFLPVRVIGQEAISPRPSPAFEIVMTTGTTVRVPWGFDTGTLHAVRSLLESRRC